MATRTLVSVDSQEQCLGMMLTLIPETPVASACAPCSSMGLEPDHPCSLAVWTLKLQALSSTHYCLADPLMVSVCGCVAWSNLSTPPMPAASEAGRSGAKMLSMRLAGTAEGRVFRTRVSSVERLARQPKGTVWGGEGSQIPYVLAGTC